MCLLQWKNSDVKIWPLLSVLLHCKLNYTRKDSASVLWQTVCTDSNHREPHCFQYQNLTAAREFLNPIVTILSHHSFCIFLYKYKRKREAFCISLFLLYLFSEQWCGHLFNDYKFIKSNVAKMVIFQIISTQWCMSCCHKNLSKSYYYHQPSTG